MVVNTTSWAAPAAFAGVAHSAFLKHFLENDLGVTGLPSNFQVKFSDTPLPLSKQAQGVVAAAAGTTSAILMVIGWMMISDSLIQNIIKERQKNIKH